MTWRDATAGQGKVIVSNGALRATQIVTGILTILLYIGEKGYWTGCGMPAKFIYAFVLGSICIATGLVLGFIAFKMSYHPVALAAPWDATMFFLYSAAFGVMRKAINDITNATNDCVNPSYADDIGGNEKKFTNHYLALHDKDWVNLVGMLLFLASTVMGTALIWVGRKTGLTSRHSAV